MQANKLFMRYRKRIIASVILTFLIIIIYILPFGNLDYLKSPSVFINVLLQTNIGKYRVRQFCIHENNIYVQVNYNLVAYMISKNNLNDLDLALDMISSLKKRHPNYNFTISFGGCGSSKPSVSIYDNEKLEIDFDYPKCEFLLKTMDEHDIHSLIMEYYYSSYFDEACDDVIEGLYTGAHYNTDFSSLKNLHGLRILELYYKDGVEAKSDLSVISEMDMLEHIIIHGDLSKISFPDTPCENIVDICIYNDGNSEPEYYEANMNKIFPNATIRSDKN